MTMVEAQPARQSSTPIDQLLFHVRVIDPWRPAPLQNEQTQSGRWSFFGLELELRGHRRTPSADEEAHETLDFSVYTRDKQRELLCGIFGPFTLTVLSKMPLEVATDTQKLLLQLLVPVQTHNTLARINKIHFLKHCTTGADVFRELERVVDSVSVAKPIEMTFLRHNHAQAATKIRPFAGRPDVQKAQVDQFQKLQADEAKWSNERKRRKQFVLQQMDISREHYLYDHIGEQLQSLHEEIMGGGQWHAYEFEKVLWYYHAPSGDLYAEHPMRNNEKTRQLIGGVQLRTRMAAKQLQHGARRFLRVNCVANAVTTQILERIADETLVRSMEEGFLAQIAEKYVNQLKANTTKAAKIKKLLIKFGQAHRRSLEEEEKAEKVVERVLDPTCNELLNSLIGIAWEACISESYVGYFKSNATKVAKAKRLWEKWGQKTVANAKLEQAMDTLASQVTERMLNSVCEQLLDSSIDGAWDACVAESYVGHLKANTTKAAKAKKLWEKWSHQSVATAKAEAAAQQRRQQREEEMVRIVVDRVVEIVCDEVLLSSVLRGWETRITNFYDAELKANNIKAVSAIKLWWKWGQQRAAMTKPETKIVTIEVPVEKTPDPIPTNDAASQTALPDLTPQKPPTPPPPPVIEESLPEVVEAELPTMTEARTIVATPELSTVSHTVALVTATTHDSSSNKCVDKATPEHWRSQLRLLKQHQRTRHSPPRNKRTSVVAPRLVSSPLLVDRSSLLLDLAIDEPTNGLMASLREPRPRITSYDDDERDDTFTASPWRRDGSFRSFHAFFNGSSSLSSAESPINHPFPHSRNAMKYVSTPSSTLPTMLRSTSPPLPVSTHLPNPHFHAVASTKPAVSSPPKKLPYIRRRKP